MEDKQLTELDRRLIGLSRYLIETSTLAVDNAKQAPAKMSAMVFGSVEYVGGVLKHISEVGCKDVLIFEFANSAWYKTGFFFNVFAKTQLQKKLNFCPPRKNSNPFLSKNSR